jgi:HAD superfamily hydrolase (TIGR01549 family)
MQILTMIKVALLDLDNTLIQNDDIGFARAFLEKLESFGQSYWGVHGLGTAFREGLRCLPTERPPDETVAITLATTIGTIFNLSQEQVKDGLAIFYAEEYPKLKPYCSPQAGAEELIYSLKEDGYRIAIATNPIYPLSAIQLRLSAGNLPLDDNFITHAENMHYAKPHPAYYAELIAWLGIEPDEAIMLGDRQENDINAAQAINIRGFLLGKDGSLEDFSQAMHARLFEQMPRLPLTPTMIFPQYHGNVSALFGVIHNLPHHFWHQNPDPNEWSPIQIICHLVDSETTTQRQRLQHILEEDNPFLARPKPPPQPKEFNCMLKKGVEVAHQWATVRDETIQFLHTLQPQDWQRPARHSIFGPTTFLEMAQFTAQHDRLHIAQLQHTIAQCK